jgi:hypothetical protein
MNKIKLVKYDYSNMSEEWRDSNPNPFENQVFALLGEVKGMPGHVYLQNIETGVPIILDADSVVELTEDEL